MVAQRSAERSLGGSEVYTHILCKVYRAGGVTIKAQSTGELLCLKGLA